MGVIDMSKPKAEADNLNLVDKEMFVKCIAKGYEKFGIEKGEKLFVAGVLDLPVSKEDPYLRRKTFVVCGFNDSGLELGARGLVTVSGLALEPLPEEENQELIDSLLTYEEE